MLFYSNFQGCFDQSGAEHPPQDDWADEHGCWSGYTCDPDYDPPECVSEPAHRYREWWEGQWHSWKMRYRARRWEGGYIADSWFKRDRNATINPLNKRFGGKAIRVEYDERDY